LTSVAAAQQMTFLPELKWTLSSCWEVRKADFDLPADRSFDSRVVREFHRDNLVCSKGDAASDKDSRWSDFVDVNAENTISSVGVRKHVCNFEPSESISSGWSQIKKKTYNLITLIDDWYLIDDTVS